MRSHCKGFIHNLIIPGILLIGVVLAGLGAIVSQNQQGKLIAASVDVSRDQLEKITSALRWCSTVYPAGDNGLGHHLNLPASPGDGSWVSVATLLCPGAPTATPLLQQANVMLGMPGRGLSDWQYKVTAGGVFLRLSAAEADQDTAAVLAQVAARIPSDQKTLSATQLDIKVMF